MWLTSNQLYFPNPAAGLFSPQLQQRFRKIDCPQTQRLLEELVMEHPELIEEINGYVNTIVKFPTPETPSSKSTHFKQIAINRKQIIMLSRIFW
ncbi:zinc finger SWIM domain-containing protein [Calothrix sp. NIES-4101]|nr:zinc finger SWIM domain-containing protein [Calothrix sp. NIES-4101]